MNPIIKEFFSNLKERDELDAIVPEVLTAMGYEVVSRPMVGTRQYGADVVATGIDEDGSKKLFLFSIKRGDLSRSEWNGASDQALRPSLDEIRDAYLSGIAPEHRELPVVIVITLGGVIMENVQRQVHGYMSDNTTQLIEYRIWSGDTLTQKVLDGAFREEVLSAELRHSLRKASAMVEQPDMSMRLFTQIIDTVLGDEDEDLLVRIRVLYLALWVLFVWAREAGNLEAPYRASELLTIRCWGLLHGEIEADSGTKQAYSHAFFEMVQLHLRIWDQLYAEKILPHCGSKHALSLAVPARESVDVNTALFTTAGRIASGLLWKIWMHSNLDEGPRQLDELPADLHDAVVKLAEMPHANPTMFVPASEDQAVDISLVLLVLCMVPDTRESTAAWLWQMANSSILAFKHHLRYPITSSDYTVHLRHPADRDENYRTANTQGSMFWPLLAMVAHGLGQDDLVEMLRKFQVEYMTHCTFQAWVPNSGTDQKMWNPDPRNGSSVGGLTIGAQAEPLMEVLNQEVDENPHFKTLSTTRLGHWPMLLHACRYNRLPPPPQVWMPLISQMLGSAKSEQSEQ